MAEPAVLVPGFGIEPGRWATRSLVRAGFRVVGADETGRDPVLIRSCRELERYPEPRDDPDGFRAAIERIVAQRRIDAILPLDDEVVSLLAGDVPRVAGAALVGPTIEQYRRLADKAVLAEEGAAAGFLSPRTVVVDAGGPSGPWPPLPSMVKPRATGVPTEAGGLYSRKPVRVATEAERDAAVEAMLGAAGEVLVQEVVTGRAWRVHFLRHPAGTETLTLLSVRSQPPRTGQSSVVHVVDGPAGLVDGARRLLDAIGYLGPGSVQAIETDGGFFVHDVNLRVPVTLGATVKAGFDMPARAVAAALGLPLPPPRTRPRRVRYYALSREVESLRAGLRGQPASAPPLRVASDLVLAQLLPGRILDPPVPTRWRRLTALIS